MAYGDFSLSLLLQKFNLQLETSQDYFVRSASVTLEGAFLARLKRHAALAVAISTEKARSEFIIAPLLLEVFERTDQPVRFFSGVELNPAPELGLCGFCDFLYSLSSSQMLITAPFVAICYRKK